MTKKNILLFTVFFLAMAFLLLLAAYGAEQPNAALPAAEQTAGQTFEDYVDSGKRIAVQAGDLFDTVAREIFLAGEVPEYMTVADMLEALRAGKVDAVLMEHCYVMQLMDSGMYPGFDYLWVPKDVHVRESAPVFHTRELRDAYNEWLDGIARDGTLDEITNRWIAVSVPKQADIPMFSFSGENGVLIMCDTGDYPPLIYFDANNAPVGFDVELMSRFAQHMGMRPEFIMMPYEAIGPYVVSGKADMSAATLTLSSEREAGMIFGRASLISQAVLVVPKAAAADSNHAGNADSAKSANSANGMVTINEYAVPGSAGSTSTPAKTGIPQWLKTGIERNLIADKRWMMILDGLSVTMIIAVASQLFSTVFGCALCFALTRKSKFARRIAQLYCGLIQGLPMVVLLMLTYYILFGAARVSNVIVAVAAFTFVNGVGIAQNLEGAISMVDRVEIEAARSMGFSAFRAFAAITLPQAVRNAMPGYTGGFVELVKSTAIVGFIAIQDLTRAGDIIRSRTFDAYFPLLLVSLIYLAVTTICLKLFRLAVRKVNGGVSR